MKLITHNPEMSQYFLRFDRGEDLIEELKKFCRDQNIEGGFFSAIGATDNCTLSFYNQKIKNYQDKQITGQHEVVSFLGNISKFKNEIIVHAHASLSDDNLQLRAGHVNKLIVSVTFELALNVPSGKIERKYYPKKNLYLIE